jgi:hypothetical protein
MSYKVVGRRFNVLHSFRIAVCAQVGFEVDRANQGTGEEPLGRRS